MPPTRARSWPRRTAWVLAACTFALLIVGGLVTTYRVGMAVYDWPTTFGYSMFAYPLDEMLANWGVTLEHGHRMLASVVGLLTIAMLLVAAPLGGRRPRILTWLAVGLEVALVALVLASGRIDGPAQPWLLGGTAALLVASLAGGEGRGLRGLAVAAHLAVVGQGLLGGTRVLENSQELAFLHGAAAQVVYALLAALVVVSSPRWVGGQGNEGNGEPSGGPRLLAALACALVYGQIVLGAWLRHTGRSLPLLLHLGAAVVVVALVLVLARRLGRASPGGAPLGAVRRWLLVTLGLQVLLGALATLAILVLGSGFQGVVTVTEALAATAHVGVGALLMGGCVAALLWSLRLHTAPAGTRRAGPADRGGLEAQGLEGGAA